MEKTKPILVQEFTDKLGALMNEYEVTFTPDSKVCFIFKKDQEELEAKGLK